MTVPPIESFLAFAARIAYGQPTDRCRDGKNRTTPASSQTHLLHLSAGLSVRASGDLLVDLGPCDSLDQIHVLLREHLVVSRSKRQLDFSDAPHKRDDLDPPRFFQVLFGDSARGDTTNGLSGGSAAASARRLEAVLGEIGVIGVRRTGEEISLGVVVRSLVLVVNEESDRRAESDTMLGTRLDVDRVELGSLKSAQTRLHGVGGGVRSQES